MLRIYFLQHRFNLSGSTAEKALYDSRAKRQLVRIDIGREAAPDETTICRFRHLMEHSNRGDQLFHLVNQYLQENGLKLNGGTIVVASIIDAPSYTEDKNSGNEDRSHLRCCPLSTIMW